MCHFSFVFRWYLLFFLFPPSTVVEIRWICSSSLGWLNSWSKFDFLSSWTFSVLWLLFNPSVRFGMSSYTPSFLLKKEDDHWEFSVSSGLLKYTWLNICIFTVTKSSRFSTKTLPVYSHLKTQNKPGVAVSEIIVVVILTSSLLTVSCKK